VKGKKENKILSGLFRKKLENAEIMPSPSLNRELMRRLRRREFFHFIPRRFNIWYAGAIITAGTLLAILMFSGKEKQVQDVNKQNEIFLQEAVSNANQAPLSSPGENVIRERITVPVVSKPGAGQKKSLLKSNNAEQQLMPVRTKDVILPERTNLPETRLFSDPTEINKLRGGAIVADNLFKASVIEGCTPLSVKFSVSNTSADSCLWAFGDGGYSEERNPEWIFDDQGEYLVELLLYKDGKKVTSSIKILAHPRPEARFEIAKADEATGNAARFMNYSTGAVSYLWNFGDGSSSELFEPRHTYKKAGSYNATLTVASQYGCTDTLVVLNAFGSSTYFISFPNAFIPNRNGPSGGYYSATSDESAQVFHPSLSGVADYQLRIFSRRGILVFESNDVNIGWDGYYKGQLSEPGVYVWKVRGNYINGDPFTRMGDVTLIKN
jgi:PKD repeat protein